MAGTSSPKKAYPSDETTSALLAREDEESSLLDPLSSTTQTGLLRQLTFLDGYTLLVSFQIGSGLFSSPSHINNNAASPGAAILLWAGGGLLAWMGAACFAELGAAIPVNGGMLEYLHYMYGDFAGLVSSFVWIAGVKPCSMGVLSIVFAEYWMRAVMGNDRDTVWLDKALAVAALFSMTVFNSISTKTSSRLTNIFFVIKLSTVGMIAVLTLLVMFFGLNGQGKEPSKDWKLRNWFANRPTQTNGRTVDWDSLTTWQSMGYYSAALWAATWSYGGWDNANLVAGEMRNASRDLPRALNSALPTVISCFLLTNMCYYIILPWDVVGSTDTVAVTVGWETLGSAGRFIFAVLVSVACVGSLNANIFTAGRLTASAATKGYIPRYWGEIGWNGPSLQDEVAAATSRSTSYGSSAAAGGEVEPLAKKPVTEQTGNWRTPVRAMILNFILTCTYILIGNFGSLVTFVGITEYTGYLVTLSGQVYMRYSRPDLHRPYKPPLWTPLVFCAICVVLVVRGVIFAPVQASVLAAYVAGVSVYYRLFWVPRRVLIE